MASFHESSQPDGVSGTHSQQTQKESRSCHRTFLSSQLNEKMLDDWGLKFEGGVDSEIADLLGDSDKTGHCSMSSSLEEVETMDIDSIQELLDDSEKCQSLSPSSSSIESPQDSQGHCTPL